MRFKDYPIEKKDNDRSTKDSEREDVGETMLRINHWVEDNEIIVLNVETLLFPELHTNPKGTGAAIFKGVQRMYIYQYFQVFRVWYKESRPLNEIKIDELV